MSRQRERWRRQLSSMRRVGRTTVGNEPGKLIAIRLDAKVSVWLCKTAEKKLTLVGLHP